MEGRRGLVLFIVNLFVYFVGPPIYIPLPSFLGYQESLLDFGEIEILRRYSGLKPFIHDFLKTSWGLERQVSPSIVVTTGGGGGSNSFVHFQVALLWNGVCRHPYRNPHL